MFRRASLFRVNRLRRLSSFTLVEVLVVIAIIGILAALTLAAASSVLASSARSRAKGEIQAISAALESYKIDNGVYPVGNVAGVTSSALPGPPTSAYDIQASDASYPLGAEALYQSLAGKTNYNDSSIPPPKYYMTFKTSQLGSYKVAGTSTYVQDPFGYPYGYSTGDGSSPQSQYPYNGTGFFDLWSTDGLTQNPTANQYATNSWISNWQ